ncbi:MAG: hypothetical protein ACE5HN_00020 [Nitrospiria bacterium]
MQGRPSEAWCRRILRELRWGDQVFCLRCRETARRHRRQRQAWYYRCVRCRRVFSDLTGTPFEKTKIPLSAWFLAVILVRSEEAPTSFELAQIMQVDLRTASRMKECLRALKEDPLIRSIETRMSLWKIYNARRDEPLFVKGKRHDDPPPPLSAE